MNQLIFSVLLCSGIFPGSNGNLSEDAKNTWDKEMKIKDSELQQTVNAWNCQKGWKGQVPDDIKEKHHECRKTYIRKEKENLGDSAFVRVCMWKKTGVFDASGALNIDRLKELGKQMYEDEEIVKSHLVDKIVECSTNYVCYNLQNQIQFLSDKNYNATMFGGYERVKSFNRCVQEKQEDSCRKAKSKSKTG